MEILLRKHPFKRPDLITFEDALFHIRIFGGSGLGGVQRVGFEDAEAAAIVRKGFGENPLFFRIQS